MNQTIIGKIRSVERLGCTIWGNPMHKVRLSNGSTYRVQNDAALNYEINNREFRDHLHVFTLTKAGRISMGVKK